MANVILPEDLDVIDRAISIFQEMRENWIYEDAAQAMTDKRIIFLDPDEFRSSGLYGREDFEEAYKKIRDENDYSHMEPYIDDMAHAVENMLGKDDADLIAKDVQKIFLVADERRALSTVFLLSAFNGPYVLSPNEEVCYVNKMSEDLDTKEEYLSLVLEDVIGFDESALENFPGETSDYIRFTAAHEGEHCNYIASRKSADEYLAEETQADLAAFAAVLSDRPDIALGIKDIRALVAADDRGHATSAFMDHPERDASTFYGASDMQDRVDEEINSDFDWDSYAGDARSSDALLQENPERYFTEVNKIVDVMLGDEELIENFGVEMIEAKINYLQDFEGAYRRRIMGQDFPERAPFRLEDYKSKEPDAPEENSVPVAFRGDFSGEDAAYSGDGTLLGEYAQSGEAVNKALYDMDDAKPILPQSPSLSAFSPA